MATSSDGFVYGNAVEKTTISPTVSAANNIIDDTEPISRNAIETTETTITKAKSVEASEETHVTELFMPTAKADYSQLTVSNNQILLCRRYKDAACGILRNCNSLPLFVYGTSPSSRFTSADGVGLATMRKDDTTTTAKTFSVYANDINCMACQPLNACLPEQQQHPIVMLATSTGATSVANAGTPLVVGYQQHALNLSHLNHQHHSQSQQSHLQLQPQQPQHLISSHHTAYSNHYALQNVGSSHVHLHSEQTKSLQELQHEVGALLEFRDLVIETFPDLKHKMVSMSSSTSAASNCTSTTAGAVTSASNTLTGGSSLASRREWEPGIRVKRKLSQKDNSTSAASTNSTTTITAAQQQNGATAAAGELSSSSLTRSRSNSHSGKKEPKSGSGGSGGENNGSVVQDSGFSTETSSSKEGHSASSTNGAVTGPSASNRLSCLDSDDELLNLLDVIHRKSNRLREEMEHLQNYERQNNLNSNADTAALQHLTKSSSGSNALTPKSFREHVERLNKEDIKQLRKERDRLLDKLAEMEAETLTGRIKATQLNNQMEELISVKKDLEEQLKIAMTQKLELSSRVQQLQQQQQKSSSSQSDSSSQRNFLSSATTVLSANGGNSSHIENSRRVHTFQPVVLEQQQQQQNHDQLDADAQLAFHQSIIKGDINKQNLGRLDGVVSTPGAQHTKCSNTDSKRFTAILLETSVLELRRHLLTLSVQNQVLMQKLEQSAKSKTNLAKRLDKSKEKVDDLCFQLEEKNIELAGTQAQLRILETRIHSNTPSSAHTSSYMQHSSSQHEYETNRSSTSTILTLSRRGCGASVASVADSTQYNDAVPAITQISTPSMKAMVPLQMDDMQQQHSSSTESAQDTRQINNRLMSRSVSNTSSFDERQQAQQVGRVQQTAKKFGGASKPSKIPLPGSKSSNYFAGKPPSGRPLSAIISRSPPSVNTSNISTASNSSSKSSLSRSTGNLLYNKSPNSLKRTDSAQSMRKDINNVSGSSLSSNNNSRASISSSITHAVSKQQKQGQSGNMPLSHSTPSSAKILQNSPLPKLKRESLTSRMRHLDSLSRVHKIDKQQEVYATPDGSSDSSTLKTIANTRKIEWPAVVNSQQQAGYTRRATTANASTPVSSVARRFSSASVVAARNNNQEQREQQQLQEQQQHQQQQQLQQQQNSDSDSGKHSLMCHNTPMDYTDPVDMTSDDGYERSGFSLMDSTTASMENSNSINAKYELLVTFDYGYVDSLEHASCMQNGKKPLNTSMFVIEEETAAPEHDALSEYWFKSLSKQKLIATKLHFDEHDFPVHHVQYSPDLLQDSIASSIGTDMSFSADSLETSYYAENAVKKFNKLTEQVEYVIE